MPGREFVRHGCDFDHFLPRFLSLVSARSLADTPPRNVNLPTISHTCANRAPTGEVDTTFSKWTQAELLEFAAGAKTPGPCNGPSSLDPHRSLSFREIMGGSSERCSLEKAGRCLVRVSISPTLQKPHVATRTFVVLVPTGFAIFMLFVENSSPQTRASARDRSSHTRPSSAPTRAQVIAARPAAAPRGRLPACAHSRGAANGWRRSAG